GGGHLELRQGSQMRYAAVPFVEAGDLLVEPGRQATEVATDGATVRVLDGAAHLSRTLAFAVTAYRGTTTITSPGSAPLAVRAPRQATLPARGVLPDHADPADYHTDDGWDRRFLGVPVEVGNQLETGASGFMQQLPAGEGTTAGFFRRVVPSLAAQPALDEVVNPSYGAADNLVGALIVQRSQRGGFTQRWRDVFDFRDPGGRQVNWGLVALDQGINDPTVLTHDLDDAIGRAPKQFALAAGIGSGSSS